MYLEMATEEDKKMAENWKADADGILIFVRRYLLENLRLIHNDSTAVDWSILRCCCIVNLSVDSGPPAKPTGHFQFLPCEYLSGYNQPKYTQYFEFSSCFPSPILSTKLCCLGQCALVLELGDQPNLRSACDLSIAMGAKIPQGHSLALQSTQASPNSCVLCRRCREVSPSVGGRNIAHASSHFPVPILRRPGCLFMEC
jgi:hypothetical protein